MFRENQNLRDSPHTNSLTLKDNSPISLSYNKSNKLIAGLYMVTDILDNDEPIRNRLRFLGAGVISDIFSFPRSSKELNMKISEILSLMEVSSLVGIISQMNSSILKKEFLLLQESIEEASANSFSSNAQISLSDFMKGDEFNTFKMTRPIGNSIGHSNPTRIGVQKGHTLMKAIKDMSNRMPKTLSEEGSRPELVEGSNTKHPHIVGEKFDSLKRERREKIVKIIRNNPNGASIKDIVFVIRSSGGDMGEKTLQRELISMVKDHVLNKAGEKRWSRYFIASSN